jgi:RNA polymerase primary sigma factor
VARVAATKRASAAASASSSSSAGPLSRTIAHNPLLTAEQERDLAAAVQDALALDVLRTELAEAAGGAAPTDEEWAAAAGAPSTPALRARLTAGAAARDRMLGANTRLVLSIARRYAGKGLDFEDLVVEGLTGLARGIDKFDPSRGFKFSTYAHWWVRQAVTRAISEQGRVVRLPVHLHEAMARVKKVEGELAASLGRPATNEEVCAGAGLTPGRLDALKRVYILPRSFEEPATGGSGGAGAGAGGSGGGPSQAGGGAGAGGDMEPGELGDAAESETGRSDGAGLLAGGLACDVEGALHTLAPRERGVLRMRYGLDDGRPKTLEEIGAAFAVTRERIRQIESKALLKLRAPERSAGLDEYAGAHEEGGAGEQTWKAAATRARN